MNQTVENAIVRGPATNFAAGITTSKLGIPDFNKAVKQHEKYCAVLQSCGVTVTRLPADDAFPDCCFVEDTAVVTERVAVITNPGHQSRCGEQAAVEECLRRLTGKKFYSINGSATLDGGDVLRFGSHFYIGVTERTNTEGASALGRILVDDGFSFSALDVRSLLHLKTGVTRINDDTIVCVEGLANYREFSSIKNKIVVPSGEEQAANCITINGIVIMPANCPRTEEIIRACVEEVMPVDLSEFHKMDGGHTCLSILW